MTYLIATILLPLFAPVLEVLFSSSKESRSFFNGHIITFIPILSIILFIPEAKEAGYVSFMLLGLGFALPSIIQRFKSINHEKKDLLSFLITFGMLWIHDFLEGATIYYSMEIGENKFQMRAILIAIFLHRLPFSLVLYYFLKHHLSNNKSFLALLILAMATLGGYAISGIFKEIFVNPRISGYFIMFVIGGLFHIIKHEIDFHKTEDYNRTWQIVGMLFTALIVVTLWLMDGLTHLG